MAKWIVVGTALVAGARAKRIWNDQELDAFSEAPYYNVITYGAIPDDGLDDTAAIQAALDAADEQSGFSTVYVPEGDYNVEMLRIGSDTKLLGAGPEMTRLILQDGMPNGRNILRNKNTVDGNTNMVISGICFDGNKGHQINEYLHLVNMWNVTGLLVDDCRFQNGKAIGFVVQGSQRGDSQTQILNSTSSGNLMGFYAQSRDGMIGALNGVLFSNCVSSADSWGFDVYLASNVTFMACEANNASGGHNTGFSSDNCVDLHYIDCLSENNDGHGFAVFINNNNIYQPNQITFSNCISRNNGRSGFAIANAYDVTLSGVSSYGNTQHGILALSSFREDRPHSGLLVKHSMIYSNGLDGIALRGVRDSKIRLNVISGNARDGIWIANGTFLVPDLPSFNIMIRDNTIGDPGSTSLHAYGVRSTDLSSHVTLLNNEITQYEIAPYLLVNSGNSVIVPVRYSDWASQWGVDIGGPNDDYDGDGVDNFTEYVFGGNPTDASSFQRLPGFELLDGVMKYVYAKRANDSSLRYVLESTPSLTSPDWQPVRDIVGVSEGGEFSVVTNRVDTSLQALFFRMRVE